MTVKEAIDVLERSCDFHYEETDKCYGCLFENSGWCGEDFHENLLALLKEQEELLRKLQKDKDRLCLEVSEWKHKFYDAPPKFVPQGIVDQIVFERDTALSQLEQLGKGLGSTFLMRELSDNR